MFFDIDNQELRMQVSQDPVKAQDLGLEQDLIADLTQTSYHEKYVTVLKQVLPHLGKDQDKIIQAQVMLALKLEGVIGKELSQKDNSMVNIIKDSILQSEEKKETALMVADRILRQSTKES
ncbi:hypothetical protein DID77_01960 [Candidatus Marinamargulisbacteria bacterium SCGC AG-439-L15]|nr:hypothetical protein DID77_01960 [Candidatus Marinamargulisbacteria bacterium SCGC AG-439-L15]